MRYLYFILLTLTLLANAKSTEAAPANLGNVALDTRSLRSVLHLFQNQNINVVYSDFLVKKDWIVWQNPTVAAPLDRLNEILSRFALKLDYNETSNTYYVVKDERYSRLILLQVDSAAKLNSTTKLNDKVQVWADGEVRPYQQDPQHLISVFVAKDTAQLILVCEGMDDIVIDQPIEGEIYPLHFQISHPASAEVIVTGSQYLIHSQDSATRNTYDQVELNTMPLRGNDPVQIINSIPGMATSGVSAKPYIQGGDDNELLFLIDGVELIDPFHLKDFYSLYSGINPNTVDTIQFYKGIYPAKYGGKMSGVMDIATEDSQADYAHSVSVDAFTSAIKLSGENKSKSLYWTTNGRRGNLSDILEEINPEIGSPRFSDLFAKVHWDRDRHNAFDLGGLTLYDNIRLQRDESNYIEKARSRYENNYGWLRWRHETLDGDQHHFLISSANIKNLREGSLDSADPFSGSTGSLTDDKDYNLTRIGYDLVRSQSDNRTIYFGVNVGYSQSTYFYTASATLGEIAELLGHNTSIEQNETEQFTMLSSSAYASVIQPLSPKVEIELGLHSDWQESKVFDSEQLSPRFRLAYQISTKSKLEIGLGRYNQLPAITEFSLDAKLPLSYTAQKSDHIDIHWLMLASKHISYSMGAYYKYLYNPRARAESLLSQFHFLPELAADRFIVQPEFSQLRGIEASLKYRQGSILAQANYAYAINRDYYLGGSSARRWDQRHTVNLQLSWLGPRLEVRSHLLWHSGWHYTDIQNDLQNDLQNHPFQAQRDYNQQTLPSFLSLNLALTYEQRLKNSVLRWNANLSNASNHNNIGSFAYTRSQPEGSVDNDNSLMLDKTPETLLPTIPSIGIQWRF